MARTAELILKLIDQVSGPAGRIIMATNKLSGALNGYDPATGSFAKKTNVVTKEVQRMSTAVSQVGAGLSIPSAALSVWGGKVVYEMEDTLNEIEGRTFGKNLTLNIAPGIDIDRPTFRKNVLAEVDKLNADNPLNTKEILEAWNQLVQAGLNYNQIKGVLPAALDFSVAGNVDPNKAVDDLTNIATSMKLPMATMEEAQTSMRTLADQISYSANISNASISEVAESFKYIGPLAAELGISTGQLSGMFASMAQSGIRGSEAGVAIRSMLVRMIRPTNMGVAALKQYGINLDDYMTQSEPVNANDVKIQMAGAGIDVTPIMDSIAAVLAEKVNNSVKRDELTKLITEKVGDKSVIGAEGISTILNDTLFSHTEDLDVMRLMEDVKNKGVALSEFFKFMDVRQGARVLPLFRDNLQSWVDLVDKGSQGFSEALRKTRMQGVVGSWNRLDASMVDLVAAAAHSGVIDRVSDVMDKVSGMLDHLADTNPKILELGTYGIMALAVLGPLGLAFKGLAGLVTILLSPLRMLAALLAKIATAALGGAAQAEVEAAAATAAGDIGGGLLKGVLGKVLGLGTGAVGSWFMSTTGAGTGEDDLVAKLGLTRREVGPRYHVPGAEMRRYRANQAIVDAANSVNPMVSQMPAQATGEQAGAKMGQGIAQGVAAQTPAVVGKVQLVLDQAQAVLNRGLTMPIRVQGPGSIGGIGGAGPGAMDIPSLSGKRATGGSIWDGWWLVGERGPELIKAGGSGHVYNHKDSRRMLGGGHGGLAATFNIYGGDPDTMMRKISGHLDDLLQRSRELSMEDRLAYE